MAISYVLLACTVLATGLAGLCLLAVRRSLPQEILNRCAEVEAQCVAVLDAQERAAARMVTWREDVEGLFEAVESTLNRVERKRRSAAASASKIAQGHGQGNGEDVLTLSRDQLVARARAQGHHV